MLQPQPSARGNKPEEDQERPLQTNHIATITGSTNTPGQLHVQLAPTQNAAFTLDQCLTANHNNGNVPMLWVFKNVVGGNIKIRFGYDTFVPALGGGGNVKIGHVALVNRAIISGEIFPDGHGGWKIDNNSGAWGAMSNHSGKSTMMEDVAQIMSLAGNMQVNARKAYSRRTWKRTIQQLYR